MGATATPNEVMFKENWRCFLTFVVLVTTLSTVIVQYSVDAQFRGYPLPFLTIHSGLGGNGSFGWHLPNLILSVLLCATAASTAYRLSRTRASAEKWLLLGLGLIVAFGATACCLWFSIARPIVGEDMQRRALAVDTWLRHLLAIGGLASLVCLFVFFLKKMNRRR